MPVYELSDEEMVNPPWVDNYDAWKYRMVKFKGRFIHKHSMLIHSKIHNYNGFEYYLPVVTKEDERLQNRSGIIVNRGWMPHEYKDPANRWKVEDAISTQEIVGVVHRGE